MNPRQLVAYLCQHTVFRIHFEDGKTVTFQAIAGIQVFPVGTEMYIGTATRTKCVGCNGLYLISELSGNITAFSYLDGKLEKIQTIAADTLRARGSADIHLSPDGKYLYAIQVAESGDITG